MRPIRGEPLLQCGTDVCGTEQEEGPANCDEEGRVCGWLDPEVDEWEGWLPSLDTTPLASRGARGSVVTVGAGGGGATVGKAEDECEQCDE